mgnify:CR=1 FL=1
MDIDKKIREELAREQQQLNAKQSQSPSLFGMLGDAYQGRLGGWMMLTSIIALLLSGIMLWCGYQFFFVVDSQEELIKWGVGLLLSSMMQIAIKMWTFNEMNRNALQREIKRLELAIEQLQKAA